MLPELVMSDPVTITTATIVSLAFQKFFEAAAGDLGKKFTETAIQRMEQLRQLIWDRFRGKHDKAESALMALEQGHVDRVDRLAVYLQDEMDDDAAFASDLQTLAQEISIGKLQDNSSITQNNYDQSTGFVTKAERGSQVTVANEVHNTYYQTSE